MYPGFDCILQINGAAIGIIRDFDPDYPAEMLDITIRDSNGWEENVQGLKSWSASGEMLWVPTNAGLQALWNAYVAGTLLTVLWTDPDGYGRQGSARVSRFHPGPQGLRDALMVSIDLEGSGTVSVVSPGS